MPKRLSAGDIAAGMLCGAIVAFAVLFAGYYYLMDISGLRSALLSRTESWVRVDIENVVDRELEFVVVRERLAEICRLGENENLPENLQPNDVLWEARYYWDESENRLVERNVIYGYRTWREVERFNPGSARIEIRVLALNAKAAFKVDVQNLSSVPLRVSADPDTFETGMGLYDVRVSAWLRMLEDVDYRTYEGAQVELRVSVEADNAAPAQRIVKGPKIVVRVVT
jgi:hypothetical protein